MSIHVTSSISDIGSTASSETEINNQPLEENDSSSGYSAVKLSPRSDSYFHRYCCYGPRHQRPALMEVPDLKKCLPQGDRDLQLAPRYKVVRILNIVLAFLLLLIFLFGLALAVTLGSSVTPILGMVQIIIASIASLVAIVNLTMRYYLQRRPESVS